MNFQMNFNTSYKTYRTVEDELHSALYDIIDNPTWIATTNQSWDTISITTFNGMQLVERATDEFLYELH